MTAAASETPAGSDRRRANIPLALVDVPPRLRRVDPAWVAVLAAMIDRDGQLQAVEVVEAAGRYRLVYGNHRVEAMLSLGRDTIEADVWSDAAFRNSASERMRAVTENMVRRELTALDRALHLAEWQRLHEALHPTTARGKWARAAADEAPAGKTANLAVLGFAAEAAAAVGLSERAIRRAVQIARGLSDATVALLSLHSIADNQLELLALAEMDRDEQEAVAGLIAAGDAGTVVGAMSLRAGAAVVAGEDPQMRRLTNGWARLQPAQRFAFLDSHAADVDAWLAARRRS